jgi:hypothetical protein
VEDKLEESLGSWVCSCCGKTHSAVPLSFAVDYPDIYANMTDEERAEHAEANFDQCIIDDGTLAIRGLIEIPIHGTSERFLWGVWARVFQEDFTEIHESWEEEGRELTRGPFKGRMVNRLPLYPDTLNLKLTIKIQPLGSRPLFFLDEEHPLTTQQQSGISLEKAREIASELMHHQ